MPPSIRCKTCKRRSFNLTDVRERFCGRCHKFHDSPGDYDLEGVVFTPSEATPDTLRMLADVVHNHLTDREREVIFRAVVEHNEALTIELLKHGGKELDTETWAKLILWCARIAIKEGA